MVALNNALQQPLEGGGEGVDSNTGFNTGTGRGSDSGSAGRGGTVTLPTEGLEQVTPLSLAIASAEALGVVVTEARTWQLKLQQDRYRLEMG